MKFSVMIAFVLIAVFVNITLSGKLRSLFAKIYLYNFC